MSKIIKIYSASWCHPCTLAKNLLTQLNQDYEEIDIEKEGISRKKLRDITGGMTVPQIIIHGKSIGGFDSLVELNQSGKLKKLLEK